MNLWNKHRIQSIFILLQTGVILGGTLLTRASLKLNGYPSEDFRFPPLPVFIRGWGWLLFIAPVCWTFLSLWMEQNRSWFSNRWTLVSGCLLLIGLILLFIYSVANAQATPLRFMPFNP